MTGLAITSRNGRFTAHLDDAPNGVEVTIWKQIMPIDQPRAMICREVLDAPWHVVCDRIHTLVNSL